jgi:hypothetical protein
MMWNEMTCPVPTPIYRIIHIDNLFILLERGGLHAPEWEPDDGQSLKPIHNTDIQKARHQKQISCGPGGCLHDYVPFYFGARSPMLYQLHTGWVSGYLEGQKPIIYLVSTVQKVQISGCRFVFTDGHGIHRFTLCKENPVDLDKLDWEAINARQWIDTRDDPDRQRKKQAEFLIHRFCPWHLIREIGVIDTEMKDRVEEILSRYPANIIPVKVRRGWYY